MRVRRGNVRDSVFEDGRAAVYVDDQVIVLSEMATVALDAVPGVGTVGLDILESALVEEFGPPPPPGDAAELTRQQVLDLVAHGVLADDAPAPASRPTTRSTAALRDALRHVRSSDQRRWSLPAEVSPTEFFASARQHHVLPYLAHQASRLDLPRDLESSLSVSSTRTEASVQTLVDELHRALRALDRSGVRALLVKGVALASQAYGNESARGAGDLDLLVSPADLELAHRMLLSAGWVRDESYPAPGPSWAWRHMVRTGYELTLGSRVSTIDLHWHLSPMRTTSPAFEDLWRRREVLVIGGQPVPTLSRYDALAHSAAHSAKDQWRWLRSLLDVHMLAADRRTWHADRPLRHDELVTVGLAALAFGVPEGAPAVVSQAVRLAEAHWDRVLALHATTGRQHESPQTPGTSLLRSIQGLWNARATVTEIPRLASRSLMPPWLTAAEQSVSFQVAVPRLVIRRGLQMGQRLRRRPI